MLQTPPLHSLIIPTYGKPALLKQCIDSIKLHEANSHYEIIVADDGSGVITEPSNKAPNEFYILKNNNTGFADTVNTGIKAAKGQIITLINNDVLFTRPILSLIEENFRDPSLGVLGAKLIYPDKTIQHAGMIFNKQHQSFFHRYKHTSTYYKHANKREYVIGVTGALFSISRNTIEKIGLLNDKYFLACEDSEYCLRAWNKGLTVLYDPKIEAIHLEGYTRGKTPEEKRKINTNWVQSEAKAISEFKLILKDLRVDEIMEKIAMINKQNKLNSVPLVTNLKYKKLELGSGYNPQPGYIHLDVRRGLPQLDYVVDIQRQKLPFKDNQFEEVLANHVIEHISFRKLPMVVSEWYRVLSKGGKLVLRTPNLKFICENYVNGLTTKEHPHDESFIATQLSDEITPSWWANLKLFSGQDYAANFHHVCFDFDMMYTFLKKLGFHEVKEVELTPVFSPGELQVEATK